MKTIRKRKGFTLMEMLIVVAIIAILVAIAIPTFNSSLHKARVAAGWANVRSAYAAYQADFLLTGERRLYAGNDPTDSRKQLPQIYGVNSPILLPDGSTIPLHTGVCWFTTDQNTGSAQFYYYCNEGHPGCILSIGIRN